MSTPLRKRRKVHTSGKRHIRKPFPRSQPFSSIERSKLSPRHTLARFLWHRRGLLCILKQATGSKRYSHSSKTSTRRLQPILYSRVFYKLISHASLLHTARQNISTPSCTCPIPVAQLTLYKIQKPTQKSVRTTSSNLAPHPSPTPSLHSTTNSTSQSNKKNLPPPTPVITLSNSKTRNS